MTIACRHERMTASESSREIATALAPMIQSTLTGPDEVLAAAK
jgi:hypothetical protein